MLAVQPKYNHQDFSHLANVTVTINQKRIEEDRFYVPPKDPLPLAVIDISAMRWTNNNNVLHDLPSSRRIGVVH